MKVKVERLEGACDICGEDKPMFNVYETCCVCGRAFCSEHWKLNGITLPHSLYFDGSEDGTYCQECVKRLTGETPKSDKRVQLLSVYRSMQELRDAMKAQNKRWEETGKTLERRISGLRKETKVRTLYGDDE